MISTKTKGIPQELKDLPQWVCFDVTDSGKTPYIAGTKSLASPNKPTDWRTFATAWKDVAEGRRTHVGFCFSSSDPYVFIDLDDPEDKDQAEVLERVDSYAQTSVGGDGVHIVCRGSFDGPGRHPALPHAGIFQENRFCVMTGAFLQGRNTIKVVDDEILQAIHTWLSNGQHDSSGSGELEEFRSEIPDMTVFELGCDTFNRFRELSNGRWQQYEDYHNDHSTADHAFIAMLCDLTDSNEQVRYLFSISGMWNDERAQKKAGHGMVNYVNRSIRRVRATQAYHRGLAKKIHIMWPDDERAEPAPIEIVEREIPKPPAEGFGRRDLIDSLPSGLIRDIAEYSFKTSYLPLQEASMCVALMLLSGICGRGFLTPTNSGLNLWLILVGGTSCGKDEYQQGLKRLIQAVAKNNANLRRIFGGEIVSGPGLETTFQETPRYISYMPEFGDTFRLLANPNAAEYTKTLTRGLLNSFNAAGKSGSSEGRRKAQGSDEKTFVERPCLCLAGEATPESIYGGMTSRELATGFLQRFMLVDVAAASWSLEENPMHAAAPSQTLVARLDRLALMMDAADQRNSYKVVQADAAAAKLLKAYRDGKRLQNMNASDGLATKEVMNRAGLKSIRLASLAAVSADFDNPLIRPEHAEWAIGFVEKADSALVSRFTTGEIGSGQVKQEAEILKVFRELLALTDKQKRQLGCTTNMLRDNVLPYNAIKERVVNLPAFATDKLGAVTAFDRCLDNLTKAGNKMSVVSPENTITEYHAGRMRLITEV